MHFEENFGGTSESSSRMVEFQCQGLQNSYLLIDGQRSRWNSFLPNNIRQKIPSKQDVVAQLQGEESEGRTRVRSSRSGLESEGAELECVWGKAGVIASKICDMEFDCDHCSLDAAIRQGFHKPDAETERTDLPPRGEAPVEEPHMIETGKKLLEALFQRLEQFSLRDDRYYFAAHTWVQDGPRLVAAVGIDDLAARLLPHANSVVFPSVRSYVRQGEYCSWFVGSEGTIAFVSPATGTIAAVNDVLYGMPDLVRTSPYEKGWLVKIELEKFQLDMRKLLPRISANARYRRDIDRLRRRLLVHSRIDVQAPGSTLFDGGRYVENVESLLGLRKYVELISVLFRA